MPPYSAKVFSVAARSTSLYLFSHFKIDFVQFVILATPDDSLMTQVFILLFVVATCLPSFGLALKTLHKVTSITQKLMQSVANASGETSSHIASAVLV
jgi:hypothetical protein